MRVRDAVPHTRVPHSFHQKEAFSLCMIFSASIFPAAETRALPRSKLLPPSTRSSRRLPTHSNRSGLKGYFRSGLDAMRRTVQPIDPLQTERPLTDYRLVILASPVWAGRCASPVRALLKERGGELPRVGYVLTRAGSRKYEEIYGQMDRYLPAEHQLAVSLRPGSEGYDFWLGDFVQNVQRLLAE